MKTSEIVLSLSAYIIVVMFLFSGLRYGIKLKLHNAIIYSLSKPYFYSKSSSKKKPDDLFTLWELFFSGMPFRMPVILIVLVVLILWIVSLVI